MIGLFTTLTGKYQLLLLANTGYTASSTSAAIAQLGLWKSVKVVTAALWEQAKAFLATPIGWISAVTVAILGLVKVTTWLSESTERAKEQFKEISDTISQNKTEMDSLNDELNTTQERIAELESIGKLSFTDEAELKRLKSENAELERKIRLLAKENEEKSKEAVKTFKKSYYGFDTEYNWSRTSTDIDKYGNLNAGYITQADYIRETIGLYHELIELEKDVNYKGYTTANGAANGIEEHITSEELKKELDGYLKLATEYHDAIDKLYESGYVYGSDAEVDKTIDSMYEIIDLYEASQGETTGLFDSVYNRDKYAEARTEIEKLAEAGNLTAESLQNLYNQGGNVKEFIDYMLSLNTVDWKTMLGDKFADVAGEDNIVSLDEALKAMSSDAELASKIMGLFANELNKVEDAAEGVESSFKSLAKTLSDGLNELSDKKDILSEVKEQLDSFGAISADNISKILEQFSDNDDVQKAVAYYLSGIGTAQQVYDAIAKGYQNDLKLQAQQLATKMQNNEEYYEAIGGLDKSFTEWLATNYDVDLKNCTNLAKTKLEVEQNLIKQLKEVWQGYYGLQTDNLEMAQRQAAQIWTEQRKFGDPNSEFYKQAKHNWEVATEAYRKYLELEERLNDLSSNSFDVSAFDEVLSTDFGKTAADRYFDELKYKLETNQITQEQYLKELDSAYKRFYSNTTEYLEEYAKYSQEVYDGFKDMYKDDLEAQKDSLEKQKDALRDFYDERKKLLEEANEEEDYEKDKSDKLREINELKILIAKLRTVGTQNAQKRIAELEEELSKAQEDYDEFEKEHILEKALENIEKEYETQEKKIQSQIDSIQDKLDKIDEDTLSVRDAIIDFAAKYGVNLDFAYGNSPTGTPTDKPNNNANNKDIAVGSTIVVKDTATHFSNKSNNVKMKSYVPGGTYEVLKISGDEVRIGRDGVATGWINKSDIVGYASGTYSAIGGLSRINETGLEMIAAPDGNGNYVNLLPKSKVFTAKATKFLWDLATKQQLPQAMYNSIAKTISARTGLPNVSVSQPITIQMGDIIVEGNADDKTLQLIKKAQEGMTRKVLEDIKKLQNKKG